jgi:TRAP-type C4-dicarboxylate transport system permease small subunit
LKEEEKNGMKEILAMLLVLGSFAVLMGEVFCRYLWGFSIEWADEVSRLLLVWITFGGIALAIREHREIFVTTIRLRLSEAAKRKWFAFLNLLGLAFNLFLLTFGLQMVFFAWTIQTESLGLPYSFFYLSLPVGSAGAIYYFIRRIRRGERGPEVSSG